MDLGIIFAHDLEDAPADLPGFLAKQLGDGRDLILLEVIVEVKMIVGVTLSLGRHIMGVEVEALPLVGWKRRTIGLEDRAFFAGTLCLREHRKHMAQRDERRLPDRGMGKMGIERHRLQERAMLSYLLGIVARDPSQAEQQPLLRIQDKERESRIGEGTAIAIVESDDGIDHIEPI